MRVDDRNLNGAGGPQPGRAAESHEAGRLGSTVGTTVGAQVSESAGGDRAECNSCSASLDGSQPWLIMGDAFWADSNRAAAREKFARRHEGLDVLRNIFPFVLPSIDRQRINGTNKETKNWHSEQC